MSFANTLISRLRASSFNHSDAIIWASVCAARISVSASRIPERYEPSQEFFKPFWHLLSSNRIEHDAIDYSIEWVRDQSLSAAQHDAVWDSLHRFSDEANAPTFSFQEFAVELLQIATNDQRSSIFGMLPATQSAVLSGLNYDSNDKIGCFFPSSAPIALALAQDYDVTLFAGEGETAIITSMLSIAAGNQLKIDRRDPISGTYGFNPNILDLGRPIDSRFDHIFSVPPFGVKMRVENRDSRVSKLTIDQYQFERFSESFTKSFTSIVPEGWLFRTSNSDIQFKRHLSKNGLASVTSLPAGIFGQRSGILTSIIKIEKPNPPQVKFTDSRTIDNVSGLRPAASELVNHFELAANDWAEQPDRSVLVEQNELESNEYNLSVDRYVSSDRLKKLSETILKQETVRLDDIAEIIRPYAAKPVREEDASDVFTAREITTGDVVDYIVRCPNRHTQYFNADRAKVDKAKVERGDVVVSMKGKIGVVGLVDGFDALLDQQLLDEPWVISQSFAIIRLKPNSPISNPAILATLLSAPWAVEKFQALAGGSTIQMIGMKDLRAFELVVPTMESINRSLEKLRKIDDRRKAINELQEQNADDKRELWSQLWNVYLDEGNTDNA